jgi:AcrR family transcriptional regulator
MTHASQLRRRQARGERRIALLLEAAAQVFAETGYEAATTNAIAARAGVSPGSLYQFFSNKEAMAEALAARFVDQLQAIHGADPAPDLTREPLARLVDRLVDSMVAFNVANPAFQALLKGPDAPHAMARASQHLHEVGLNRIDTMLAAVAPQLSSEDRRRHAQVCKHVSKALLPLILAAEQPERERLVAELKEVLRRYLAPLVEVARIQEGSARDPAAHP